mgnify:CR=1 FL=1
MCSLLAIDSILGWVNNPLFARFSLTNNLCDWTGTVESINEIQKEHLDLCYDTFYHPSNMCLVVVGPVSEEDILTLVNNNQSKKKFRDYIKIQRKYPTELLEVKEKKVIKPYSFKLN